MKTIQDIPHIEGKKILMRVDFDVPVSDDGMIAEDFRIIRQKAGIHEVARHGTIVVLIAHIAAVPSFEPLLPQLRSLLDLPALAFISDISQIPTDAASGVWLLDSIRRYEGEEKNDTSFAKTLANGFDVYINNAFAVCHRTHASVVALAQALPAYAGPLLEEEVRMLGQAIDAPSQGKVVIMGGAKTETKVPVIKHFLSRAEYIIVGGVLANDVAKVRGDDIRASNIDANSDALLAGVDVHDDRLILPIDYMYEGDKIWDIGTQSLEIFRPIIEKALMIIWNGPVGFFEKPGFESGTRELARCVASSSARKIIGGGDTIAAVHQFSDERKFDFISTGGGAMLCFLAGETLPGLAALVSS